MLEKLKRRFFGPEDSLPDNSLPKNSMPKNSLPEDSPGESLRDDSGFRRFPSHRLRRGRDRAYDRMQVAIREIRQLVQTRLTSRQRQLAVAAMALALVGGVSLAANAAVTDSGAGQSARDSAAVDREEAADRADRAQREDAAETEGGERRAAEPKDSPKPEPTETEESAPEESSDEPEPEPAKQEEPEPEPAPDWVHPMPGAATTSCYGMRGGVMHAGVDLASPPGTPMRSVGDGTVVNAGWVFGGYGISVVVDHGNGYLTHYAHASEATVSVGDRVSAGEMIAREGSTGDSSGPHLHFEVHSGMWNQVEPTSWLRDRGVDVGGC